MPVEQNSLDIFEAQPLGTVYVINSGFDYSWKPLYRHNTRGWLVGAQPTEPKGLDFNSSDEEFAEKVNSSPNLTDEQRQQLFRVKHHIAENYTNIRPLKKNDWVQAWGKLCVRLPVGSNLIIATAHNEARNEKNNIWEIPETTHYTAQMRDIAAADPYVGVVSYSDVSPTAAEIAAGGGAHCSRRFFLDF